MFMRDSTLRRIPTHQNTCMACLLKNFNAEVIRSNSYIDCHRSLLSQLPPSPKTIPSPGFHPPVAPLSEDALWQKARCTVHGAKKELLHVKRSPNLRGFRQYLSRRSFFKTGQNIAFCGTPNSDLRSFSPCWLPPLLLQHSQRLQRPGQALRSGHGLCGISKWLQGLDGP